MEPQIQYARTNDGVNIAYYAVGEGPAVVVPSSILWSHLRIRVLPEFGLDGVGLGRHHRVVRYDSRGTGLSDRSSTDFSLQARLSDLDAVVKHLDLEQFALIGRGHGAGTAVAYAVEHPTRVSHLVLWWPVTSESDWLEFARKFDSLREFAGDDWEGYTVALANANIGFQDADLARRMARRYRESMTPHSLDAFFHAVRTNPIDIRPVLPRISCPTLVISSGGLDRREERGRGIAQQIAAAVPGARLVVTQGPPPTYWGEKETRIAEEFLGIHSQEPGPARTGTAAQTVHTTPSSMTAILFADIADSTALTESLGDTAFRAKARGLDASLRTVIRDHAGTCIDAKTLGDGVLATFTSARQAIEAALACARSGDEAGLSLHLGLHAGDVIREDDNVFGGAVNIAARISGLSAAGEVLVSDTVRSLARTSAGVSFEDRGEQALKGVGEAVRVWAVARGE